MWGGVKDGIKESAKDLRFIGESLETVREITNEHLNDKLSFALTIPTQVIEGTIFAFLEEKNTNEGSRLRVLNPKTREVEFTDDAKARQNYALNGINNTPQDIVNSYFTNKDGTQPTTLIERENPTHGVLGDLIESGLGKISDWVGLESAIAMNRIAKEDMLDRKDIPNAVNLYHSQGTIIAKGAMQIYANENGSDNQINQTQKFVAVGPAVLKSDWENSSYLLGNNIGENSIWEQNPLDPVRYLAAPSNAINQIAGLFGQKNFNSPVYAPNLFEIPIGLSNAYFNMDKHSVTNPDYSRFFQPSHDQKSLNPGNATPISSTIMN